MLQLTPQARRMIRAARASRNPKNGRQLGEQRHRHLVTAVAGILRKGDPTLFRFEAPCIAAVRAKLILSGGWRWRDADRASREVVREALRLVGAVRPSWNEASIPNYAQPGGFTLFERTRCLRCGGGIPPENRLFCSARCQDAHHMAKYRAEQEAWAATVEEGL